MPENQQNYTNAAPISSNGEEEIEYPKREGEPDCDFYLRKGWCGYGVNCRYNHPPFIDQNDEDKSILPLREGQPDCGFFVKTGSCKFGSSCKYHHPPDRRGAEVIAYNSLGLPLRKEPTCSFYTRYQKCKFGAACKFNHPEPTPVENALPVSEAAAAGIGSSLPSTAIPFVGAYPAWPWNSSSYFPGPQAYMPYIIPHMQGAIATQNWNGYLGYMSSSAASNVMGTDLIYASKYPGGQGNLSTLTSLNLPERPDQPECRYFMKNGGCKFGSECKYHHPKEQIAHSLGPRGLQLRPGDDIYANFNSYGGYISAGYYFGMPSIVVPNQPYFPGQRNLLVSSSTETSQSKSSKITDWIQKPETVENKNRQQHSATKPVEDSLEKVDDHSNACTEDSHEKVVEHSNVAAGEISRDQSD